MLLFCDFFKDYATIYSQLHVQKPRHVDSAFKVCYWIAVGMIPVQPISSINPRALLVFVWIDTCASQRWLPFSGCALFFKFQYPSSEEPGPPASILVLRIIPNIFRCPKLTIKTLREQMSRVCYLQLCFGFVKFTHLWSRCLPQPASASNDWAITGRHQLWW